VCPAPDRTPTVGAGQSAAPVAAGYPSRAPSPLPLWCGAAMPGARPVRTPRQRGAGQSAVPVPDDRSSRAPCGAAVVRAAMPGTCPSPSAPPAGSPWRRTERRPRRGRSSRAPCRCRCRAGSDAGRARPARTPRWVRPGAGQSAHPPVAGDRTEHRADDAVVPASMPGACPRPRHWPIIWRRKRIPDYAPRFSLLQPSCGDRIRRFDDARDTVRGAR
jgi:hypothetical protein